MTANSIEARRAEYRMNELIRLWAEMGVEIGAVTPGGDTWPDLPLRAVEGGQIHYVWRVIFEGDPFEREDDRYIEGDFDNYEACFYLACSEQQTSGQGDIIESSARATCPMCRAKGEPAAGPWWPAEPPATPRELDFGKVA